MYIAYVAVTCVAIAAHVLAAVFDYRKAGFVVETATTVRVPIAWFPHLATLKILGAAGLLAGLLGFEAIGIAAAVALVGYFVGAVGAFVRAGIYRNSSAAIGYLGLTVATLAVTVWH